MSVTSESLWYIESHLSGDLRLEEISAVVGVSQFHLCRAFGVSLGLSVAAYVRARRLTEAARALAAGAPEILAVALDAGYGSHEAFTRAFRQQFGQTPEQVRTLADSLQLELQEPIRMDQSTRTPLPPPRTAHLEALLIFGLSQRYHCDSKAGIPSQWDRFLPHFGNIPGQIGNIAYGVVFNTDDAGNFEYLCGVEVKEFPSHPAGFTSLRIPPQTYAVFEHKDHISSISATWGAIWEHALAESGFRASDGPCFERYGEEFDGRTGLGGLELWVPIKT